MKTAQRLLFITTFLLLLNLVGLARPVSAQDDANRIIVLTADGVVAPALREYIARGLQIAERRGASAVIIRLNTPGGAVDSMTDIVSSIRNSDIPVIVYVSPRGALAGSAGTVITMAGHVAAMAPETIIGAASPVGGQGEDLGETIEAKLKEALRAQVRALMEGRPDDAIALAEDTIENAIAVTAGEALQVGMIDYIAADLPELLRQLNEHAVRMPGGETIVLQTAFVEVDELEPSFIEQLLAILTDPNIVFLLLTLGVQAILIELGSPGGWVAGFMGAVSLALAAFGLGFLETNLLGLAFLAISFVLFILDIKAPTHGALTIAGVVSFIVGSLVLFNSPGTPTFARVSVPLVIASGVIMGGVFALVVAFAVRSQSVPIRTGQEGMIGRTGRALAEINPEGLVQLGGEQWSAILEPGAPPVPRGGRVIVTGIRGVRLHIKAAGPNDSDPAEA